MLLEHVEKTQVVLPSLVTDCDNEMSGPGDWCYLDLISNLFILALESFELRCNRLGGFGIDVSEQSSSGFRRLVCLEAQMYWSWLTSALLQHMCGVCNC